MTKISKIVLLVFSVVVAIVYFVSCEKYSYEVKPIVEIENVSYSQDVQPVFNAKCVSCHGGSISPNLSQGNSYKSLAEGDYLTQPVESNKLYKTVADNLHSSFTNQEEKSILFSWILQGAEDN
jgi:hypothetical protein